VTDLRESERFPFREHILIDGSKPCTSTDISRGGIYVSAIQYFPEHSVLDLTIPYNDKKITLKGKVQYYQAGIGLGIQFIELTDEQKAIINEIVDRIAQQSSPPQT
jgi:hypothetical protein